MSAINGSELLHIGSNGRKFRRNFPTPCYDIPESKRQPIPPSVMLAIRELPVEKRKVILEAEIPARDAGAWLVPYGCIWRIEVSHGPQVGDVNIWNARNPRERFYSSKTRQLHASHLTTGDSFWSSMPYIRPLATIVSDTLQYGIDDDNAGVHDVIGSRCDPYTHTVMTGENEDNRCHNNLTRAVREFGLLESDVHDVFNVFMCTGFERGTGRYFSKPSPAEKGDYVELLALMDLVVACSACPQGDVSMACGSDTEPTCYPLGVKVYSLPEGLLQGWKPPSSSAYSGMHGLVYRG